MPVNDQIPVDLLHWLLALLPIGALGVLMVRFRWTAQQAGAVASVAAAAVALIAFRAAPGDVAIAGAKGVWDALSILFVIWAALLIHEVMSQAGGYEALRLALTRMSDNEMFDVLALGWVFTSFLQGIVGFGTPIAIVAPLLVAFGMRPVYAVVIPLIAHIWAKFYGTLAEGWLATLQVVEIDEVTAASAALQAALLLMIPVFMGGFAVVWMYGRAAAVRHAWPLVLVIGAIHGLGQVAVTLFDPMLAGFLPATVAMFALYPLSRWPRFAKPALNIVTRPAMRTRAQGESADREPPMGAMMSLFPYILLTVLALGTAAIPAVKAALERLRFGLPFPEVTTGYGVTSEAAAQYSPIAPLTHPAAALVLAALVTWWVYHRRGYYAEWARVTGTEPKGVPHALLAGAVPASVPIFAFLVMASVMNHSGQNATLALGVASIAPGYVVAFLSNGIGVLGAFTTSSSTSSNLLFADLQLSLARLKGLPEASILAAQSAGGAIGNAIAPANLVMGASTVGISGQESAILRKTGPWTLVAFVLTGVATVVLVLVSSRE
ncbi:MAG TPA: L-lactate permease [Phycisphaerales bacterium]|nr:L-lactate permease [Phycisphaerales bacterium]